MLLDPSRSTGADKFFRMWAGQGWKYRGSGRGDNCWDWQEGGADAWFESATSEASCDVNWSEGVDGELGKQGARLGSFLPVLAALIALNGLLCLALCAHVLKPFGGNRNRAGGTAIAEASHVRELAAV